MALFRATTLQERSSSPRTSCRPGSRWEVADVPAEVEDEPRARRQREREEAPAVASGERSGVGEVVVLDHDAERRRQGHRERERDPLLGAGDVSMPQSFAPRLRSAWSGPKSFVTYAMKNASSAGAIALLMRDDGHADRAGERERRQRGPLIERGGA